MPVTENIAVPRLSLLFLGNLDSNCKAKDREEYEKRNPDTVPVNVINRLKHWRNVVYSVSRKGEKAHNCDLPTYL